VIFIQLIKKFTAHTESQCEIWRSHDAEYSRNGLQSCDAVQRCGRIQTFRRTVDHNVVFYRITTQKKMARTRMFISVFAKVSQNLHNPLVTKIPFNILLLYAPCLSTSQNVIYNYLECYMSCPSHPSISFSNTHNVFSSLETKFHSHTKPQRTN
jgi:hypothetical protein